MSKLLLAAMLGCTTLVCAQSQPQATPEPSLADQARAASKSKDPGKHAKVVADNDLIEEKKSTSGGAFPELGTLPVDWAGVTPAANEKADIVVGKMVQFIATHPKDEAKRTISDWFSAEEQTVKDLKQRKEQLEGFSYTGSTTYDNTGRTYSQAAALDRSDRNGRDGVNRSLSHIEAQLSAVRDRGAKKGIPWSWMLPNQKDVRDKPIVF